MVETTVGYPLRSMIDRSNLYISFVADIIWIIIVFYFSFGAGYSVFGEGRDYQNYLNFYHDLGRSLSLSDQRYESGFVLIAWAFKYIVGASLQNFIAFIAAISLFVKVRLLRQYTKSPFFAFVAYVCLFYPVQEYAQIRSALALSLAYWAIHCGVSGNWWRGFLLVILALMFHFTSALIGVVFVLMYILSRRNKILVSCLLGGGIILISIVAYTQFDRLFSINPLVTFYIEAADELEAPTLFSILHIALALAVFARVPVLIFQRNNEHTVFIWMTVLGLVSVVALYSVPVLAQRVKDLFVLSVIFWAFNCRFSIKEVWPSVLILIGGFGVLASLIRQGIIFS